MEPEKSNFCSLSYNDDNNSETGHVITNNLKKKFLIFQGSHLGPGTYQFKSFAEKTIEKVTSTRGPYDLFSGDRNKPISDGHFAAPVSMLQSICKNHNIFSKFMKFHFLVLTKVLI